MTDAPIPQRLMPRHVAIIMDGNGRWAKKRGMPRAFGHRKGVETLEPIIEACGQWGIEALTLFAFSTENWARPKDEVNALMGLINEFFNKKIDELDRKGVCIRMLGDLTGVPEPQRRVAEAAMARTKDNTGLKLNIALNYGSQQEILRAAQALARKCARTSTTRRFPRSCTPRGCPRWICSSAPAASSASATSCSTRSPTRSWCSCRRTGRTLPARCLPARWRPTRSATGGLAKYNPEARASEIWG